MSMIDPCIGMYRNRLDEGIVRDFLAKYVHHLEGDQPHQIDDELARRLKDTKLLREEDVYSVHMFDQFEQAGLMLLDSGNELYQGVLRAEIGRSNPLVKYAAWALGRYRPSPDTFKAVVMHTPDDLAFYVPLLASIDETKAKPWVAAVSEVKDLPTEFSYRSVLAELRGQ